MSIQFHISNPDEHNSPHKRYVVLTDTLCDGWTCAGTCQQGDSSFPESYDSLQEAIGEVLDLVEEMPDYSLDEYKILDTDNGNEYQVIVTEEGQQTAECTRPGGPVENYRHVFAVTTQQGVNEWMAELGLIPAPEGLLNLFDDHMAVVVTDETMRFAPFPDEEKLVGTLYDRSLPSNECEIESCTGDWADIYAWLKDEVPSLIKTHIEHGRGS